jgi:hypothetical protein
MGLADGESILVEVSDAAAVPVTRRGRANELVTDAGTSLEHALARNQPHGLRPRRW